MLGDLELPQVQHITTEDRRDLAEHKPPAMAGSLLQNLGRRPTSIRVYGVATGPGALEFATALDELSRSGEALSFTADIVADSDIAQVLIDDLDIEERAGTPQRINYSFALREFVQPAEPEIATLDPDILEDATAIIDGIATGLEFLNVLQPFIETLTGLLDALHRRGPEVLVPSE